MEQWLTARHRDLAVTHSVSSQSLCLCKNTSEPFTPRLLPAGRIKIHTHRLGMGPGSGPAQSRDKEIEAQRGYKPFTLCRQVYTCLLSVWILWDKSVYAINHLIFTVQF